MCGEHCVRFSWAFVFPFISPHSLVTSLPLALASQWSFLQLRSKKWKQKESEKNLAVIAHIRDRRTYCTQDYLFHMPSMRPIVSFLLLPKLSFSGRSYSFLFCAHSCFVYSCVQCRQRIRLMKHGVLFSMKLDCCGILWLPSCLDISRISHIIQPIQIQINYKLFWALNQKRKLVHINKISLKYVCIWRLETKSVAAPGWPIRNTHIMNGCVQ